MKKNVLVGQPGGPTVVINTSSCGVIAEDVARPEGASHMYDMVNGIEGFLPGHVMGLSFLTHEDLILLKQTPTVYLSSYRLKLPENLDAPVYSLLFERFKPMDTEACFYADENDSIDTADRLSRCIRICRKSTSFIGVSETIDNDLPVTNYTPGYGSAAKYVASTVREVSLDTSAYQQSAVAIVELIGRHAGWVAAAATLARKFPGDNPLLAYMPEVSSSMRQFFKDVEQALSRQPSMVVCVPESICDKNSRFICEYTNDVQIDTSGHKMLTDCTKIPESYVRNCFQVKVRSMELSINQRYSNLLISAIDVQEAGSSGRTAVEKILQGETGKMVTCSRLSGPGYELEYGLTEVGNVCNREKSFPVEWVMAEGSDIGSGFLNHVLPLTQGQPNHIMENGLPRYLCRK